LRERVRLALENDHVEVFPGGPKEDSDD